MGNDIVYFVLSMECIFGPPSGRTSAGGSSRTSRPAFYCGSDNEAPSAEDRQTRTHSALTKHQLKAALVHLLSSDEVFVESIHRAYVQSLGLRRH